jgi:Tfp pilus assembly protein PilN
MKINLLPYEEERRYYAALKEISLFSVFFFVVVSGIVGDYFFYQNRIDFSKDMLSRLKIKMFHADATVEEVFVVKKKIDVLDKKITFIQNVQKTKFLPLHILNDLSSIVHLDEKLWLVDIKESQGVLTISGGAMQHASISQFQIALQKKSKYFSQIKLQKIETDFRDKQPYLKWSIVCVPYYS